MKIRTIKACLLASAIVGAVSFAAPAFAQSADEEAGDADIIVTARRVDERLQDVPISITVMSAQQLADRNIQIANDLTTYTPSLSSNERYGPEKQSFSLRGFNQDQSTAPTVGVYFAETVGVRAQGGTTSGNSVGAGAFMDLANVQVLKGPQGTLFGRNTTGGAILLTPKKPSDKFEGYVEGSAGNHNMWKVTGALNVPLSDSFKVRLVAERSKRDGFMTNKSGIPGTADKLNDRNYQAYRLSIVADLTPDLENYTIFHYSKSDTKGYAAKITSCADSTNGLVTNQFLGDGVTANPLYSGTRHFTALACGGQLTRQTNRGDSIYDVESSVLNPFLKIEQWQVINTTTWKASDNLTIKNIMSYGEFREKTHFDLYTSNFVMPSVDPSPFPGDLRTGFLMTRISPQLTTTGGAPGGLPLFAAAGTPFKYIELDLTDPTGTNSAQRTFTEELQLQGKSGNLDYVVGGYLEFARPLGLNAGRTGIYLNCTSPQDLACANPLFFGSISESRTSFNFNNHGVFAQGTYKFDDKLSLTAGIRYTFDNIYGYTVSTRAALDPGNRNPASFLDPRTGVRIARQCTDSFRLGNGFIAGGDPNLCRTDLANPSKKPTWVINADYKFSPDMMMYAKWSRGYRQGGLNFTNPGLESWSPEGLDSFEIGAKTSFRGTVSGYLNVAGYYNKLRDFQLFAGLGANSAFPGVAGGAAIINAGRAHSYGIEVDGSLSFFDRALRFDLAYAYLNTKIDTIPDAATLNALTFGSPFDVRRIVTGYSVPDTTGLPTIGSALALGGTPVAGVVYSRAGFISPTATAGSEFTLAPHHKLTLGATYTLPVPENVGNLSVGMTMAYTSRQVANGSVPANLGPLGGGILPSRTLLNANVNWSNVGGSPVDAAFFVTNLTNKAYAVNTGGGWNSSGIGDVLLGEPRMWGVRLKYSFGN